MSFMNLFRRRPLIGMVHLLPLPGSPRARDPETVLRRALADARAVAEGGGDGLLVENYGDLPFVPEEAEPHVPAMMAVIARELIRATGLPTGINVLRNDVRSALAAAAASGAAFVRANIHTGSAWTDQGLIHGRAHETLRYRRALGTRTAVFADLLVKHASPVAPTDAAAAAREAAHRGLADVLLVTGARTGEAADAARVRAVKAAVPGVPVYVASGVTPDNLQEFSEADGFIVGSGLKRGGKTENPVDPRRVRRLSAVLNKSLKR
ncbi:MAG TPA: BtpA/SgcQ family protein [Planctomycetota bacterium]|nr:BtpA/SgcQ family protein [Planctomycetota bacterium]